MFICNPVTSMRPSTDTSAPSPLPPAPHGFQAERERVTMCGLRRVVNLAVEIASMPHAILWITLQLGEQQSERSTARATLARDMEKHRRRLSLLILAIALLVFGVMAMIWPTRSPIRLTSRDVPSSASRPTAEKIIHGYIAVTGGEAARRGTASAIARGTARWNGLSASVATYTAAPDKLYSRLQIFGSTLFEEAANGSIAWERKPLVGVEPKTGEAHAAALRQAAFYGDIEWQTHYRSAKCVGEIRFNERPCFEVRMVPNEGAEEIRYYDQDTHLLLGTSTTIDGADVSFVFEEYKWFGALRKPCRIVTQLSGQEIRVTIDNVKYNVPIAPNHFAVPANLRQ